MLVDGNVKFTWDDTDGKSTVTTDDPIGRVVEEGCETSSVDACCMTDGPATAPTSELTGEGSLSAEGERWEELATGVEAVLGDDRFLRPLRPFPLSFRRAALAACRFSLCCFNRALDPGGGGTRIPMDFSLWRDRWVSSYLAFAVAHFRS